MNSLSARTRAVLLAVAVFAAAAPGSGTTARAVTEGPSCGIKTVKSDQGVVLRVLFAKNGAVQQYQVVDDQENTEAVHDFRIDLERQYGTAGVNAPPLKIVSFKKTTAGGMMVPDKAIDSCGRTLNFNS